MARPRANQQDYQEQEPELKTVYIAITGADKAPTPVNLTPGITPLDVFEQLNLRGFRLEKPGGSFFALGDDLYSAVDNSQKLHASKDDVGAGSMSAGTSTLLVMFACDTADINK